MGRSVTFEAIQEVQRLLSILMNHNLRSALSSQQILFIFPKHLYKVMKSIFQEMDWTLFLFKFFHNISMWIILIKETN